VEQPLIWFRAERARRGPLPAIDLAGITRTAVRLADTEGLEAVSMRRIGGELNAAATSLYWHLSGKDDLYELMVDAVVGEVVVPEPTGKWREDLRRLGHAVHETLGRHRWFVQVGIQPGLGPNTRAYGERALALLDPLGGDLEFRINVLAALNNYVFGFIHRELAWEQLQRRSGLTDTDWTKQLDAQVTEAAGVDPVLAQHMTRRHALAGQPSFDFGLDCLLNGLESARVRPR
jgi:AcrR family transcriptional regulator